MHAEIGCKGNCETFFDGFKEKEFMAVLDDLVTSCSRDGGKQESRVMNQITTCYFCKCR